MLEGWKAWQDKHPSAGRSECKWWAAIVIYSPTELLVDWAWDGLKKNLKRQDCSVPGRRSKGLQNRMTETMGHEDLLLASIQCDLRESKQKHG